MALRISEGLTFDDVLLIPQKSDVMPREVDLSTSLTRNITLSMPLLSSPMDTVTESDMAIAMALQGGIGILHKNLTPEDQALEVAKVKRYENGFIKNPVTVQVTDSVQEVVKIRETHGYGTVPVVDGEKLVGLITKQDYFLPDDIDQPVKEVMVPLQDLVVAEESLSLKQANKIIREHKLSVLPIVSKDDKLVSLVTRKDLEKNEQYPLASKDDAKHLRVGAAIGVGDHEIDRARTLVEAGVDVIVVDTAHGHSARVIETIRAIKKDRFFEHLDIIGGNIATVEGAKDLISAGVDAVKVGIGPGSICTTRVVAGIGVPQITAIDEAARACKVARIPLIADGGIRYSGDIVKALAAGADMVMIGNLFAGTDESPGEFEYVNGRVYKSYRGMGSLGAMRRGSSDRYAQGHVRDQKKFVPEGVEGRVDYKGKLADYFQMLVGGVKSGFGYTGASTVEELHRRAVFVKITGAGQKESHPHSVTITKEAPNYHN
ncbi:MAG: IMP dehydrogenase [Candidatus Kerfeldbacteria bacterium]|nr:IMP dehydrogenase [Candidatus Kerfeldbacteria bacterium]